MEEDKTQQVAKDFLDLWQKQIDSSMHDPNYMQNMMQSMAQIQQQFINNTNNYGVKGDANASNNVNRNEHGDDELNQLKCRLRECEKRIDQLELQLSQQSQRAE